MSSASDNTLSLQFFALAGGAAGAIHALASSAHPLIEGAYAYFSIFSLFLLVLIIGRAKTFWQAFWAGWMFALTWLVGSVWWIYISMHDYGGMPAPMSALALFLFCLGLGLIYGFAMGLVRKLSPPRTVCTVSFAVWWMFAEILRGYIFTGFPWAASGYAHLDGLLAAYAPWLGVYGVSALAALVAASLALLVQYIWGLKKAGAPLKPVHAVVGVLLLGFVYGTPYLTPRQFTKSAGTMKVALLQGNVEQSLKFDARVASDSVLWYIEKVRESKAQGVQLVVLPETAIPFFLEELPLEVQDDLFSLFVGGELAGLVGAPAWSDGYRMVTNSLYGFAPNRLVYRYDKYHLVPFGEFVPLGFQWFVNMMDIPLGDMEQGVVNAPSFEWAGQRIAPNICYEDLFGEELARRFLPEDAQPTMMANASNIAWFGETVAIPQHLEIARMRSLEFQRPMLRATNTGATAVINHEGQVTALLPSYTQGVLIEDVEGRYGLTPYALWSGRFGLTPLLILAMMVLAFARFMQRKLDVNPPQK